MNGRSRLKLEMDRLMGRVQSIDNEGHRLSDQIQSDKKKLGDLMNELDVAFEDLKKIKEQHDLEVQSKENVIATLDERVALRRALIEELDVLLHQYHRVMQGFQSEIKENELILANLRDQEQTVKQKMIVEEAEIGRHRSDLDIYRTRMQKYIDDNDLPIKLVL